MVSRREASAERWSFGSTGMASRIAFSRVQLPERIACPAARTYPVLARQLLQVGQPGPTGRIQKRAALPQRLFRNGGYYDPSAYPEVRKRLADLGRRSVDVACGRAGVHSGRAGQMGTHCAGDRRYANAKQISLQE